MKGLMTEDEARKLVDEYINNEKQSTSTQEILESGVVPELVEFTVKPGKVSDSVFGEDVFIKEKNTGIDLWHYNPILEDKDGKPIRIMVRTEKISTHDKNRGEIPFKDQILAVNHNFMRRLAEPFVGTSQYELPGLKDNSVVIVAENLNSIPVENVLRAYMAKSSTETSLYQAFINGKREFCGHILPDNLVTNGKLPYVMDTPSTKSDEHDESVTQQYLFENNICTPAQYKQIRNSALALFGAVSQYLETKGLIAVDTKTEHGINSEGLIVAQDEIWTMDSSRFWKSEDYNNQVELFSNGEIDEIKPTSFSKEFARGFSKGDQGYEDETRAKISVRYIMGIQALTGERFEPDLRPRDERVVSGLETVMNSLVR